MRHYEAEEVLRRVSEYNGNRTFTQPEAKQFADAAPDWLTEPLAKLAVDNIAKAPTLDGAPPFFTPEAIFKEAKAIRAANPEFIPDDDPHAVVPSSAKGRFAATFTAVVERVFGANEHVDFNKPSNYFWALDVAKGVLDGTCNVKGEEYAKADTTKQAMGGDGVKW
ncbi:hypothetical protein KITKAT_44 [Arthrobacter phage Kitkat]|uniref:Uncharacterized protein n=2 Tax=Kelleziovirus TaxID=1982236 RepID=A0A140G6C7_9CAUD|nr:hypothetical protein BJD78_gp42 [Arthrobacter phage KellEzio]YP_009303327.1 hypothetical protein BJD77_gp044 [Arthrobacter phage Kitkat]AMM44212.1 hypothetical protein KELLEZIO_42 [Arthrobacter phage KellEzio]AMM44306.1 hypothetical protein KITKAT_44 [Arthrobacter phage Kitkat]